MTTDEAEASPPEDQTCVEEVVDPPAGRKGLVDVQWDPAEFVFQLQKEDLMEETAPMERKQPTTKQEVKKNLVLVASHFHPLDFLSPEDVKKLDAGEVSAGVCFAND